MSRQKIPGQTESEFQIRCRGWFAMFTAMQKTWKREQTIMIRPASGHANRPPAFWRYISEVIGLAGRCATTQVKSEPEFV